MGAIRVQPADDCRQTGAVSQVAGYRPRAAAKLDELNRFTGKKPLRIMTQSTMLNVDCVTWFCFLEAWVHIAFAVSFFIFVGLCETLRHGIFGLNPSETTGYIYSALALFALFILRGDVVFTMRQPRHALYENARLNWTWSRSVLGLFLGPLLWIIPAVYGLSLTQINIMPISAELLIEMLVIQVLLIALAEEFFFREAVVKAFRSDISAIYLISVLAFFIFYVPQGLPAALVAAGTGMFYVTLRLIGTNILVVALVHGATNVMFAQVFSLGLTSGDEWVYATYFLAAATVLSGAVYYLFAQKRSVYLYA